MLPFALILAIILTLTYTAQAAPAIRENKTALFRVAVLVVACGILNRLNVSVFGMWSYTGPIYRTCTRSNVFYRSSSKLAVTLAVTLICPGAHEPSARTGALSAFWMTFWVMAPA